ncbi:MAG TPA: hypothetical protein VGD40_12370 [Chryseosolibacter sp.]
MTDQLFTFNPLIPYWLLAVTALIALALFVWLEIRKSLRYKIIRIVAVVIMVGAVIGITLQPNIRTQTTNFSILLTGNANPKTVDSLENKFPGAKFVRSEHDQSGATESEIHEMLHDDIKVIVGNGLNTASQDLFEGQSFNYLRAPLPSGIIQLMVPDKITVQTENVITCVYNNPGDSTTIILEGPGGKEDSVLISNKGVKPVNLTFAPKQSGDFSYVLRVNGQREILPLTIWPQAQMKILVVQMFPTFETGYLKNVLADNHQLVFRYQLSKNNFRYEYLNYPNVRVDRLSQAFLNTFDLAVIDTDALSSLSQAEKNSLQSSVASGLGVLIMFTEKPKSTKTLESLLPIKFKPIQKDSAQFTLNKKITLPAWPVQPQGNSNIIPTVENKERILAGYIYKGFGKIGFQLLQETYSLTLAGDSSSYKKLWTTILQKNARTKTDKFQIRIKNDFPIYANEPVKIEVAGSSTSPPILIHDGIEIPMMEDALIDDIWKTKVWPKKSGWHEIRIKGDSAKLSYFVSNSNEWKSLATANAIRRTTQMASVEPITASTDWEYKPFAPCLFYLLFVIAAGTLWLVPKI